MVVEALLRIIAGLDATAGTVTIVGWVAAIPQLGTGFQADSSGCGNIYLGGLSLGLSRRLQWRRIRVWRRYAPDRGTVCRSAGAGVFWFEWGNDWHELPPCTERAVPMASLTAEIDRAWAVQVLELSALADTAERPARSPLLLLEDGMPLRGPRAAHEQIRSLGRGRYSPRGETLYFTTSDNNSPATNERAYSVRVPTTGIAGEPERADAMRVQPKRNRLRRAEVSCAVLCIALDLF